jgi:hypothetical protein
MTRWTVFYSASEYSAVEGSAEEVMKLYFEADLTD